MGEKEEEEEGGMEIIAAFLDPLGLEDQESVIPLDVGTRSVRAHGSFSCSAPASLGRLDGRPAYIMCQVRFLAFGMGPIPIQAMLDPFPSPPAPCQLGWVHGGLSIDGGNERCFFFFFNLSLEGRIGTWQQWQPD